MADVIVDVILPNAITTDVNSPSYSANANVFIPGADGPPGPTGPAGVSNFFKIINVSGQADLIPTGSETLTFIAGTGISIVTNTDLNPYKSIKIDASPLSGYFQSEVNLLRATVTGNYVTKFNGQFSNRPTVNGTGILLSGEEARLPNTILYTTGNQIKSGRLIIGDSIVDANSTYTLSVQSNDNNTWLEILNHSGANQGVFFGIQDNNLEQYNWQGGDILFFTSPNHSAGDERLRITNSGSVGIGTNSPSEKLEVAGNLKVSNSGFFTNGIKVGTGVYVEPQRIIINGDPVITKSSLNAVSGYFEAENVIGYKANLTQGFDNYYVQFPQVLSSTPKSVVCTFQNIVDDMAYYFTVGSITNTGFYINFSDNLLNNGYFLNIQVKK